MPPETCGICGAAVALGDAAHVMLNAKSEEGVRDYYVCPTCFEEELLPHFPEPTGESSKEDVNATEASTPTSHSDETSTDESDAMESATDAGE
ncbi:MAG TPA: hypothetical protein VJ898_02970 [Natrialbaceae archaeon]|nr:hypothetical protein [Natrialbaceae archaeon]